MNQIKVAVHSTVDLITNSSTSIFTWSDKSCVDAARTLMSTLMEAMGVKGSVDDFFTIKLEPSEYALDVFLDNKDDYIEEYPELEEMDTYEQVKAWLTEHPEYIPEVGKYDFPGSTLAIYTKDNTKLELVKEVQKLFKQEAYYS